MSAKGLTPKRRSISSSQLFEDPSANPWLSYSLISLRAGIIKFSGLGRQPYDFAPRKVLAKTSCVARHRSNARNMPEHVLYRSNLKPQASVWYEQRAVTVSF